MADKNYRPATLNDMIGQEKIKRMLNIYIKASQMRNKPLDHVLISGPSGYGKTTTALAIANELGVQPRVISAPALKTVLDLTDAFMQVEEGDVVIIDEVHALKRKVQEEFYFILENFAMDIMMDESQQRVNLPHFTVIACTTDLGGLEEPCRNRFPINITLAAYDISTMAKLVRNAYKIMNVTINNETAELIGTVSRGVPRIANSFVQRIYDYALVMNEGKVDKPTALEALDMMDIDKNGLNENDRAYLRTIVSGKPIGVATISKSLGMDTNSIETVIEPYLIKKGYVVKTLRGRQITKDGIDAIQ